MSQERPTRLRAGAWSVEIERTTGWVRSIRLNGHEVGRAVYAAVRDAYWRTQSQRVVHHKAAQNEGRFEALWHIELDDFAFKWTVSVVCDGAALSIEWLGEAGEGLDTRRTGLCFLHPLEAKGLPVQIRHSDGSVEDGAFPTLVAPTQPFFDIAAIGHPVAGGHVEIEFSGDVFEMEDQRNWTDASFKTYCRPQSLPQPYRVVAGERVRHAVRLFATGHILPLERACETLVRPGGRMVRLPRLGTVGEPVPPELDFALPATDPPDWDALGLGRVHFGGNDFVGLNRNRPPSADFDALAFGACPQVHAFDERTIMENVRGLVDAIQTAKEIGGGKPICVGPIRFRRAGLERDFRIDREVAPAWMVAVILACAEAGAHACCILEEGDFRGPLKEAAALFEGVTDVELLDSADPYRAIGFRIPDGATVLVNMRSVTTSVRFDGDLELDPYEIRVLA